MLDPFVPIQVLKTPILDFLTAADLLVDTLDKRIAAHVENNLTRAAELTEQAKVTQRHVGGLALAARQAGYHLTTFAAETVERRCLDLGRICLEAWAASIPKQQPGWEDGAYEPFHRAIEPFYPARNAVFELAVAVRHDLWEKWPFREPGEVEMVRMEVPLTKTEQAMMIYLRDPNQSDSDVAKQVPCHPSLLSHSEQYRKLRSAHAGSILKGSKPAEGNIEAADD